MISALLASPILTHDAGFNPAIGQHAPIHAVQPFAASAPAAPMSATCSHVAQVDVQHVQRDGDKQPSFYDDWYNRIHVTPAQLNLGNVVSQVTQSIEIWNGFEATPQTLDALTIANGQGVTIAHPGATPMVFAPGQSVKYPVSVSTQGPAVINATLSWTFAGMAPIVAIITGQRLIAWTAAPDWGNAGVTEDMAWLTDILTPNSGIEQRRQLRIAPRRTFSFDALLTQKGRRLMEALLFDWSARVWALPIWPDGQLLPADVDPGALQITLDTTHRDYVAGGVAIILQDASTCEVVAIDQVNASSITLTNAVLNTWKRGAAKIYPVRSARLTAWPALTRHTDDYSSINPSFIVVDACDWTASIGSVSYRGQPVMEWRPNEVQDPSATFDRLIVTTDPGTGVFAVQDLAGLSMPTMKHHYTTYGATDRDALRSALYALAGRMNNVWVPTWNQDLIPVAQAPIGSQSIDMEWSGYTQFLAGQIGRRDIRIEWRSGMVRYRRVTGSVVLDDDTERLSLDTALDVALDPAAIRAVSFMTSCRLDSDQITVTHIHDIDGTAAVDLSWRADLHDV